MCSKELKNFSELRITLYYKELWNSVIPVFSRNYELPSIITSKYNCYLAFTKYRVRKNAIHFDVWNSYETFRLYNDLFDLKVWGEKNIKIHSNLYRLG